MRTVNITFDDDEFENISKVKDDKTNWHDFLLVLVDTFKREKMETKK